MFEFNSAFVGSFAIVWLVAAYFLYGRFIEKRLIPADDAKKTPAHRLNDGVDFLPAKPLVLFGHHFASIAGAGPIIGPVMAVAYFGWGVSFAWILLGVVFVGAVHDYTTLMLSLRHDGETVPSITGGLMGKPARTLFMVFVWITLIFVIAVFLIAAKKTLMSDARVVIPAFGMIPLAMGFGWLTNRMKMALAAATGIALSALLGLFALGMQFPLFLHAPSAAETAAFSSVHPIVLLQLSEATASQVWILILMLYGAVAAVLPVWLLLQPRDYIGYWILAFGMAAGIVGMLWMHKPITSPLFISGITEKGPLWPMLFIMVACGAVSGFHSLVSSGTTSKQLDKESHGLPVVFGAMLTEGALAVLALLAVSAGIVWTQTGAPGEMTAQIASNPIGAFARGFGAFTEVFLGPYGVIFGVVMINAFVLTTLDTSVRLSRFITAELAGPRLPVLQNRFVATLVVSGAALGLALTGNVSTLWRMFGASNQLVASLAMIVVSVYLMKIKKPIGYTLIPALFMLVTTCGALIWQFNGFVTQEGTGHTTLAVAAIVLLLLALYVGARGVYIVARRKP
ncbi:MAG: carbon starvation protein A [Deltaproteobacteria bacterium]|nr:carbon starvation protein A [Deltaproteobacteria bacterium]MBN2674366.1 carbon starvation protein A [Deltaproteobacteria bacterium]